MYQWVIRGCFISSVFLCCMTVQGQNPQWEYAGHLYCSWATHNSMGLGKGYMYRFDLTEAQWRSTPEDFLHWYNRILLKKTADRTLIHAFNDLTPYDSAEAAKAASPASFSMVAKQNMGVRLWLHDTIYQDHLFGESECEVWKYPPSEVSVPHSYALTTAYASPTRIIADGISSSKIWAWLARDGSPYDGEDGSEHTEYIKVTTDKGSFSEYEDLKEAWIFYNGFGDWISLYADTTSGTAHVTVEWEARNEGGTHTRHLNVVMGDYSLVVSADPEAIAADGESTATVTAQVIPYTGSGGEIVTLKTDKGRFSNGSDTLGAVLDAAGVATATFVGPQEKGYCFITGEYNYASDTATVLALGKTLIVTVKPNSLLANSDLQASVEVQLFDGYNGSMDGEIVTLTTDMGTFENGGRTMEIVIGGQQIVLLHPDDGQAGTATVSGVWIGAEETLSDSDTIDFFTTALSIQSDKSVLWANGEETAQVMVSLFQDGTTASGGTVFIETDLGSLSAGGSSGSTLALPLSGGGSVTLTLVASQDEGTATLTATFPAEGLSDSCQVEMKDYKLSIDAQTAEYHSITGTGIDEFSTRQFEQGDPPQVTAYGLTSIPVVALLTGPDVAGKTLVVNSAASDAVAGGEGGTISFPDFVVTDGGGKAEFVVTASNLYAFNQGSESPLTTIDITVAYAPAEISAETGFSLINNLDILLDAFRQLPPGPAISGFAEPIKSFLAEFVGSMPLGANNLVNFAPGAATNIASNWFPNELNHYTCGGCQAQALYFLDDLRINHPQLNWLLNGLDYGPLKQLNGGHNAAVIWPSNTDFMDRDKALILDFWASQNPQQGVHTWDDWLASIGFVGPLGDLGQWGITRGGSSDYTLDGYYPTTGNDYPDQPQWVFTSAQDAAPKFSLVADCPVTLLITDSQGRKIGVDPDAPANENPLRNEIPGAEHYPRGLPDGSHGWFVEIPDDPNDYTLVLSGYQSGSFNLRLIAPDLEVVSFKNIPIGDTDTATLHFNAASNGKTVMNLSDGTVVLSDRAIEWGAWQWDPVSKISRADLTLINQSDQVLYGPCKLILEQITPDEVTLDNPDGLIEGKPYIDFTSELTGGVLASEQSIRKGLNFQNPNGVEFAIQARLSAWADVANTIPMIAGSVDDHLGLPRCSDDNYPLPSGDINKDCRVDLNDLILMSNMWMVDQCTAKLNCFACDLITDGQVDIVDLMEMAAHWLDNIAP